MSNRVVHTIVVEVIAGLNKQLPPDKPLLDSADTVLYGMDSVLDSFDLVTLIVQIEQQLYDRLGVTVTLANEKALSLRQSPFHTVGSLENYVEELLQEAATHA